MEFKPDTETSTNPGYQPVFGGSISTKLWLDPALQSIEVLDFHKFKGISLSQLLKEAQNNPDDSNLKFLFEIFGFKS